jgi:intracellular sulfur oxidation DsrE/DsrF family protein
MRFRSLPQALALAVLAAVPVSAQTGEALLRSMASYTPVKNQTFPVPTNDVYKVVWNIHGGTETPKDIDPEFKEVATFLVMARDAGVPNANIKLAMVVHGNSARNLLQNDAYKAMTGVDNPNIPLLEALNAAGVQVIICGQSIPNRKLPGDKLLPFVKVSLSASFAFVTLHNQGYVQF